MAFTKKKKRRITVNDQLFYWAAAGDDGWIRLMIMSEIEGIGYHQIPVQTVHNGK